MIGKTLSHFRITAKLGEGGMGEVYRAEDSKLRKGSGNQGVTHRDLKPGNVMITHDGRVKVLDFGIAKLAAEKAPQLDTNESTWALTQPGNVIGTIPYMAPEQVQGRGADSRSEIC